MSRDWLSIRKIKRTRVARECWSCGREIKVGEPATKLYGEQDFSPIDCYECADCTEEILNELVEAGEANVDLQGYESIN
jgi:hypothetical protein